MFKLTVATLVALFAALASPASAGSFETVVHDTTTNVELALNEETVICSFADYSGEFLKILIPQLASITLLDHENLGAGAPCVAAGPCAPGNMPSDIIHQYQPTEMVTIRVQAIRTDQVDDVAGTCATGLKETVEVDIRGVVFTHQRYADLGARPVEDCGPNDGGDDTPDEDSEAPSQPTSDEDAAADNPSRGYVPDQGATGGCRISGQRNSSAAWALLALSIVVTSRRRRAKRCLA